MRRIVGASKRSASAIKRCAETDRPRVNPTALSGTVLAVLGLNNVQT